MRLLAAWAAGLPSEDPLAVSLIDHMTSGLRTSVTYLGGCKKTLEMAFNSVGRLPKPRQRRFARCTLLKTAQWALDCRVEVPSSKDFLAMHQQDVGIMLDAIDSFGRNAAEMSGTHPSRLARCQRIVCRSAAGIDRDGTFPTSGVLPV